MTTLAIPVSVWACTLKKHFLQEVMVNGLRIQSGSIIREKILDQSHSYPTTSSISEAWREALPTRKTTQDEILHCARICRVENVIRRYLEASV